MSVNRVRSPAKRRIIRLLKPILFLTFLSIFLSVAFSGSSRKIKVMPLGDSITGSFVDEASYRFWLWEKLVSAGFGDKVEFVGARSGCGNGSAGGLYDSTVYSWHHNGYHDNTIWNLWERVPGLIRRDTSDVVMIHLGTNDIINPDWPDLSYSQFFLGAILDSIRVVNPRVTFLLCQIIPGAYNPDQQDSLLKLNQLIADLSVEKNQQYSPVILVDQYHGFSGNDLTEDGFHPNETGEKLMANKFFIALLPVLQKMDGLTSHIIPFTHDTMVVTGSSIVLNASVNPYLAASDVSFVNDAVLLGHGTKASDSLYSFTLNAAFPGFYNVKAIARDFSGRIDTSKAVLFGAPVNSSPTLVTIPQIQGTTAQSPYVNMFVQTTGVVTAVQKDSTGFWMQDTLGDGNPQMSDAIFVSRNSGVALPSRGNLVTVCGMVQDYAASANYLTTKRLACVSSITVLGSNHAMPNIVTLPGAPADIASSAAAYNLAQGMLVKFTPTTIVGPSSQPAFLPIGNLTPGSGFYGTTWVSMTESLAPNVVDYNPEVLLIGSKTADVPQVRTHDTLWSLTGVVDYDKGFLCIQPLADSIVLSHSSKPASPVSKRSNNSGTLRISTFDLGGVFDTFDTWSKNDPVVTPAVYATEITKMRKAIVEELLLPSILCVQNVENTGVLSDIAASVNANGGKYKIATARNYMGFSVDKPGSWDARGVINGFMYDTTFFSLDSIKLISGPSIDSAFGKFSPMPAADPLVGIFKIAGIQLPVVNVSLIDKSNDIPFLTTGWPFNEQSKQIRKMQAHAVRSWIDAKLASTPGAPMIIAGEFNDYPFAEPLDAADCPVSIVKGNAGKGETVFYNLYDFLPADSRYSCIVNGRAQMTEQLMIAPVLAPIVHGIDVLHFNAGFEDSFSADSSTAVRSSGHDPVEIRF